MPEIIIALMGVFAVCCYAAGAQKLPKQAGTAKPKEHTDVFEKALNNKELQENADSFRLDAVLENIENYDGTAERQKTIKPV